MNLTGKRALVTGGSRGIGAAIAQALAADGADVAITYQMGRRDRSSIQQSHPPVAALATKARDGHR